jgi:putative ABC transport system permease protein
MAVAVTPLRLKGFQLLDGALALDERQVLISESYAFKQQLAPGAPLTVLGHPMRVAGVFRDYRSEHGVIAIALDVYQTLSGDRLLSNVSFPRLIDAPALDALLATRPHLRGFTRHEVRTTSLAIFERTFALTDGLKLLSALLAAVGLLAALLSLELERAGLDQRLRALGLSARERLGLKLSSALRLGLHSALLALPIGALLAQLLTAVINRQAFGWRFALEFRLNPGLLALLLGATMAVLAALIAHTLSTRQVQARIE